MNGHALNLLRTPAGPRTALVRVDLAELLAPLLAVCTEPLELRHDCEPVPGVWAFTRGAPVPGRPGTVRGLATCSRCGAARDAVVGPGGRPLAGPVRIRRT